MSKTLTGSVLFVACLSASLTSAAPPARLDATALQKATSQTPSKVTVDADKNARKGKTRVLAPSVSRDDEQKLKNAIESYGVILRKQGAQVGHSRLLIGRAQSYLALAQRRLLRAQNNQLDAATQELLRRCVVDVEQASKSRDADSQQRAYASFLTGLAQTYLNLDTLAVKSFTESLRLNPRSAEAPWIGFYLAEEYFSMQRYKESIDYYRSFYRLWEVKLKRIALYKMGWAYMNLNQSEIAQKVFLQLVAWGPLDETSKDAMKDMAFIMSKFKSEDEILRSADQLFSDPALKLDFLKAVYANQEVQGVSALQSKVFAKIFEYEKDEFKRFQLQVGAISTVRREYASADHFRAFDNARKSIIRNKWTISEKGIAPSLETFEQEVQRLVRSYLDTYAGRAKTAEKISQAEIAATLRQLFEFYDGFFTRSAQRPVLASLWLEVCADSKDWGCVDNLGLRIKDDAALKSLREKALLDRIAALEELIKKDAKRKSDLLPALKEFSDEYPSNARWLPVVKRLVELELENKNYATAENLSDQVLKREPNVENFYRLQWIRFSAEKYEELMQAQAPGGAAAGSKADPRLVDLRREASLKLAVKARGSGDFKQYSQHIGEFLSNEKDVKKRRLAYKDQLDFLIEKGSVPEAVKVMMQMPLAERSAPEFTQAARYLCFDRVRVGQFAQAKALFNDSTQDEDLRWCHALSLMGEEMLTDRQLESWRAKGARVKAERRDYLLGVMALLQPQLLLKSFDLLPPQSEVEQKMAFVALRIKSKSWNPALGPREKALLGALAPAPPKTSPLLKKISTIVLPAVPKKNSAKAIKRFAEDLQYSMNRVRNVRSALVPELKGLPPEEQMNLVTAMSALEKSMADVIRQSPAPAGLSAEELSLYQSELEKLAQEFGAQVTELSVVAQKIKSVIDKSAAELAARVLPASTNAGELELPGKLPSVYEDALKELVRSKHYLGAMVVLDTLRAEHLKDERSYYSYRLRILMQSGPSEAMRRYLFDELESAGRTDLIESWKEAVKS